MNLFVLKKTTTYFEFIAAAVKHQIKNQKLTRKTHKIILLNSFNWCLADFISLLTSRERNPSNEATII